LRDRSVVLLVIIKAQKAAHLLQKEKYVVCLCGVLLLNPAGAACKKNKQTTRLQVKCNEEVALVEEMRAYLKRRAEIEFKYCEEQTALAAQYQSTRKLNVRFFSSPTAE